MKKISYEETESFKKDFKRLLKKFHSLISDLEIAKKNAIELYHLKKIDNKAIFLIPNFNNNSINIYKLKKFACRSLKGHGSNSGIRIIYAFHNEHSKVVFIEIYFKGDQELESQDLIRVYLKNFNSEH